MKRRTILVMLLAVVLTGCKDTAWNSVCHIHGVALEEDLEGRTAVLTPVMGRVAPAEAKIINGKFEMDVRGMGIAKLTQKNAGKGAFEELMVVIESGDLNVRVSYESSANGTPQNDSLQSWKELTTRVRGRLNALDGIAAFARENGDSISAAMYANRKDSLYKDYVIRTHAMADGLGEGSLHDFLYYLYPAE